MDANADPAAGGSEPPQATACVFDLGKPGAADCGRGVDEMLGVINALESHGIPCCVAGTKALVYYGAHRVPMNWELCVPTDSFDQARTLLMTSPLNEKYELWHPVMPNIGSLAHTYPRFTLKGANFFFILMPAFECRVDCAAEQCERSIRGIPYPKLEQFAKGLVDTQQYADLSDLVDGMDLDEQWGEAHLQFDQPVPIDYIQKKNEMILQSLPGRPSAVLALLSEKPNPRERWRHIVRTKRKRINDELPRHIRYMTRFRKVGSRDPRENKERVV